MLHGGAQHCTTNIPSRWYVGGSACNYILPGKCNLAGRMGIRCINLVKIRVEVHLPLEQLPSREP